MVYPTDHIISMVRTAMRRNKSPKPLIHCRDPDMLPLDRLILSHIEPCAARLYSEAPVSLLTDTSCDIDDDQVYWHPAVDALVSGHIILPDDWLRMVVFEMSDWHRPVHDFLTVDSPYYTAASRPYSGARGTPSRPVCLLTTTACGNTLEIHSCHSEDATVTQAKYLPRPHIDIEGGINLDPRIVHRLAADIAAAIAGIPDA